MESKIYVSKFIYLGSPMEIENRHRSETNLTSKLGEKVFFHVHVQSCHCWWSQMEIILHEYSIEASRRHHRFITPTPVTLLIKWIMDLHMRFALRFSHEIRTKRIFMAQQLHKEREKHFKRIAMESDRKNIFCRNKVWEFAYNYLRCLWRDEMRNRSERYLTKQQIGSTDPWRLSNWKLRQNISTL